MRKEEKIDHSAEDRVHSGETHAPAPAPANEKDKDVESLVSCLVWLKEEIVNGNPKHVERIDAALKGRK